MPLCRRTDPRFVRSMPVRRRSIYARMDLPNNHLVDSTFILSYIINKFQSATYSYVLHPVCRFGEEENERRQP